MTWFPSVAVFSKRSRLDSIHKYLDLLQSDMTVKRPAQGLSLVKATVSGYRNTKSVGHDVLEELWCVGTQYRSTLVRNKITPKAAVEGLTMAEVSRGWYKTSVEQGSGAVEAVPVLLNAYGYFFGDLKFMSEAGSGRIMDRMANCR
jgi:hypothetical protein